MITPTRNQFNLKRVPKFVRLAFVGFFMALAYSFIGTVWTLYIKNIVGKDFHVSLILSFLSLISLVAFIFTTSFLKKYDKTKIFKISIIMLMLLYPVLIFYKSLHAFLIISCLLVFFATLRINSFGILVKENSSDKGISKNEGLIYTFFNTAWVIGPIIAGFLLGILKPEYLFLFASFFFLLTLLIFNMSNINGSKYINSKTDSIKNALSFFKNKNNVLAYLLGGGVNFWWILIYGLMPLYIISKGYPDQYIGFFLFATALPLIFLEYPFSKLVKKLKYPTLFKTGYAIPTVAAFVCFFSNNDYIILGSLVFASVGLAMIEPTTESYFLRNMKRKEELKYYNIYNTTIDINILLASLISSISLYLVPFKYLFLLFGIFMFIFFILSSKTKKIS
jgi:MFS family permease